MPKTAGETPALPGEKAIPASRNYVANFSFTTLTRLRGFA
jgi:hypothetical protein